MAKVHCIRHLVWLVVPIGALPGCGDSLKPPQSDEQAGPAEVKLRTLPKLGDYLPPLDGNRIQVAPPRDWYLPPRSSKWIARFQISQRAGYPKIVIQAEDYDGIFKVSEENVGQFARQIAAEYEADGSTAKLASPVEPIKVGQFCGVDYVRRAKSGNMVVDRLFMETVVAGRKYSIELRAVQGTVRKFRPHLLAVAGGIKFLKAAAEPEEEGAEDVDQSESEEEPPTKPVAEPEEKSEE